MIACPMCGEGWSFIEQAEPEPNDVVRAALVDIVEMWISEGFTTPPYTPEQYEVFAWLGIAGVIGGYDTTPGGAPLVSGSAARTAVSTDEGLAS